MSQWLLSPFSIQYILFMVHNQTPKTDIHAYIPLNMTGRLETQGTRSPKEPMGLTRHGSAKNGLWFSSLDKGPNRKSEDEAAEAEVSGRFRLIWSIPSFTH